MSTLSTNQPDGTPTWVDIGVPDLDHAIEFYRAMFGWDFNVGPAESGHYTMCLLRGHPVAAITPNGREEDSDVWWNVYFATADCAGTVGRVREGGGEVQVPPMDVMDQGIMAIVRDPSGAQFGLWQGKAHIGCEIVNEPSALVRNDLVTPDPASAREFYPAVFDFTLDGNPKQPELDFTFLRRPDGHEIGGIIGDPSASGPKWETLFEVSDTDAAIACARANGGSAGEPNDMIYGRVAELTDPFGAGFSVITRAST